MRNIKIFVGGSIQGLEKERNEINDRVNKFNINPPKIDSFIEEQTFITVYSYANFGGQTGQQIVSDFIVNEIDFAIFLFDGSKGCECVGTNTQEEIDVVRQHNIPYEVFLTPDANDPERTKQAGNTILEKVIDADKKFYYTNKDIVRILSNDALGSIIRRHVDDASWVNDNFAYYTIEARFKSTYDKEILAHKLSGVPTYKEFLNSLVFKGSNVRGKEFKRVRKELLDITSRFAPLQFGEHHYEYLRRLPFLVAEFYFYYYILYTYLCCLPVDYVGELDPYLPTKRASLESFIKEGKMDGLNEAFEEVMEGSQLPDEEDLQLFLEYCVNANTTDLSQQKERQEYSDCSLLIDNTDLFREYLSDCREGAPQTAVCITDNCGPELYSDILLGLFLLRKGGYNEVRYQVKELPIFVSDTTMNDVKELFGSDLMKDVWQKYGLGPLEQDEQGVYFVDCGNQKRILFESHREWHRPNLFEMSESFAQWDNQDNVGLIVVKGDMNYRRLVGDKNYDYNDTIKDKVGYVHKSLLVLRSLKSNVFLGGSQKIKSVRPDWKTSGEYGVVHFVEATPLTVD